MSIIIIIREKDNIYIGCQTHHSYNDVSINTINTSNDAIWFDNNKKDILLGHVGRDLYLNILKTSDFFLDKESNFSYKYIVDNIVPHYFDIVNEIENHDKEKGLFLNSQALFAKDNEAFVLSNDGTINSIEDFAILADPTTRDFYYGAFYATEHLDAKNRLIRVFSSANNYLTNSSKSFLFVDLHNLEIGTIKL